jgi:GrpB-like predicted nucleotidyltransferase (UPF0157 family)
MVPDEVVAYGREVAASLQEVLGDDLIGAYYVGSIALGGYVAGESDLDVVAVSERAIPDREKPSLADAVFDTKVSCPARGLEFTLYRREVAASSPVAADFEVNVNGGPRMARAIHLEPRAEPGFCTSSIAPSLTDAAWSSAVRRLPRRSRRCLAGSYSTR